MYERLSLATKPGAHHLSEVRPRCPDPVVASINTDEVGISPFGGPLREISVLAEGVAESICQFHRTRGAFIVPGVGLNNPTIRSADHSRRRQRAR
jgi:hypothetical protein